MRASALALALSLTVAPGCYLLHGYDGPPRPSFDGGEPARRDAGAPSGVDAGEPSARDAGPADAGPPRPREPEPDPGPDGRPSDGPGADDWVDPPELGEEDPCCVLGEPVRVTSRDEGMSLQHEPPVIAWGPGRWAIAVMRYFARSEGMIERLVVFELAADGTPLGDPRVLEVPALAPETPPAPEALRWAAGRWALAIRGDSTRANERMMHVRVFDAAFVGASPWSPVGPGTAADVAYLAHGDRWLAFTSPFDALRTTPLDEVAGVGPSVELRGGRTNTLRAASFGSRAAIAPLILADGEAPDDLVVVGPSGAELGRIPLGAVSGQAGAMAALRDLAITAVVRGDRVEVEIIDPFALRSAARPRAIGETGSSADATYPRHSIDVAGSNKFGVAGVCWGVPGEREGGREDSQLRFRLVGPDGRPRGAAATIVSSPFRGSSTNCSVGSDDLGFLVGWWDGSELWVRRVDVVE